MASKTVQGVGAVLLLIGSNSFMNVAWYLHLKFKSWPIILAIAISWGIAFFEYCLQVPANRMGHFSHGGPFTAPQLKVIQEAISLSTFAVFSVLVLKEKLRWIDAISFALIFSGVAVSLVKPGSKGEEAPAPEVALGPMPVAPAPEAASAPAPAVEQVGGRRLLQLVGLGKKPLEHQGAPQLDKTSGALSTGSSADQHLDEHLPAVQLQHVQQAQLASADPSLGDERSTAVLIASGVDVYASSSQQGVHSRGHSHQQEGPPDEEQAAAVQQAAAAQR